MEWIVIGADPRFALLCELAAAEGIRAITPGRGLDAAGWRDAVRGADMLIVHSPWRGAGRLPSADCPLSAGELMDAMRPDARMLALNVAGMPVAHYETHGACTIDLGADEEFASRNGVLTAEGAIFTAMGKSGRAIAESNCLVIGYGRIGRPLTRMLIGLGAHVTAAARRPEVRALAGRDGADTLPIEGLPDALPGTDFIFSTPPDTVLDDALLSLVKPDAVLMDLASPPYGFNLDTALTLGLRASREPALPGRYCPRSAAGAMMDAAMRAAGALEEVAVG